MSANIISIATAELEKKSKICEKETADFVASEEELVATVDTVGRAIKSMGRLIGSSRSGCHEN